MDFYYDKIWLMWSFVYGAITVFERPSPNSSISEQRPEGNS